MNTTSSACELTITRIIPASPEEVFDAWIQPETRMQWWAAQPGMQCDNCVIEPRQGGRYRINMWSPDRSHQYVVVGEFEQFDRPRWLVMSWSWEPGSGDPQEPGSFATGTTVSIEFESTDGGTRLTLRHTGFADQAQRDNHQEGWAGCLDNLTNLF